jgi:hypothetical protein
MLELEQVRLCPAATSRVSNEEAQEPNYEARRVPVLCRALVLLIIAGLSIGAGCIIVQPRYVVCDAPTTLWLAGVSTTPNPTYTGTFYTKLLLVSESKSLTVTVQCNVDAADFPDAFHTPVLGQAVPDIFVCRRQGRQPAGEDGGLTCARHDTSHHIALSAFDVFMAILVFASALVFLLGACVLMNDARRLCK